MANITHKIHLASGMDGEITTQEAERIAHMVSERDTDRMKRENRKYLKRALHNIRVAAEMDAKPECENELKQMLYYNINGASKKDVELLYETMEAVTAMHLRDLFEDDADDDEKHEDED